MVILSGFGLSPTSLHGLSSAWLSVKSFSPGPFLQCDALILGWLHLAPKRVLPLHSNDGARQFVQCPPGWVAAWWVFWAGRPDSGGHELPRKEQNEPVLQRIQPETLLVCLSMLIDGV